MTSKRDSETYTSTAPAKSKTKAEKMSKNQCLSRSLISQKKLSLNEEERQKEALEVLHSGVVGDKPKTARSSRQPQADRNNGIKNVVKRGQEKPRRKVEERDAIWSRIAKDVDNVIKAEASVGVKTYQVEYIVNAILECALLKPQLNNETLKKKQKPRDQKVKQQTS